MNVPAQSKPRLALTLGDCAGIGPELVLRMTTDPGVAEVCRLTVYGNRTILERVASASGLSLPPIASETDGRFSTASVSAFALNGHRLLDFPFAEAGRLEPGRVQAACGQQAYDWVRAAVDDIRNGCADALVTAPINKEALHLAGLPFPGHTELLADLTHTPDPRMAFYAPGLLVTLATIHEPLADVPRLLTLPSLLRTIRLTHEACVRFGCDTPRIGVLALNPHAGENGLFGHEEATVITPAIRHAQADGMIAEGPLVPDTAFTWLGRRPPPFDAYVALYHDQGLIPFKAIAFDTGVNVTLGLPIIRTSPDHGTAFDLAWKGEASSASLRSAIILAARMASAPSA